MSVTSDGATELRTLALGLGLARLEDLGDPGLGTPVRRSRTSWVIRVTCQSEEIYVKTYDYPGIRDRVRGLLRNTAPWTPSRARREAEAAHGLAAHGFEAAEVRGWADFRRLGLLRRAVLATRAFPGRPLDEVLPLAEPGRRAAVAAAVGSFVARLHRLGFRDRNLDLRNLLLAEDGDRLRLCKIDSPRHRLVRPGSPRDDLAAADWARLLPQLEVFGLGDAALRAAAQVT